MKLLLVDNSNTRTKFAISPSGLEIEQGFWLPTGEISHDLLSNKLREVEFDAAVVCSVVPEKRDILETYLSHRGQVHLLNHESPLGLRVDYPRPQNVGADRLANAVGVIERHQAPAIVIDFGTAVTFDVISSEPAYIGGVIAPGLGAMGDYLGSRTALLPKFDLSEPAQAIGKSTIEAMRVGAVVGYRGLVKEILKSIRKELGVPTKAIATGGDAELIATGVSEIDTVDPEITMAGIAAVGRRIF